MGAVHHAIAPSMYPKLDYNIETDFVPVGLISSVPQVIVVNPQQVPVPDLKALLAYLRKNPGKLNYASAGNGTSHHLAGELFKLQTKTFITHIPYRGAGPALQDLIAGQVDMMFDGLGSSAAHIKGGRIKALAVAADKRAPGFPDVPAAAERGCPTTRWPPGTACGRRRARRRTWSSASRPSCARRSIPTSWRPSGPASARTLPTCTARPSAASSAARSSAGPRWSRPPARSWSERLKRESPT